MHSISNYLLLLAIPIMATYFYQFAKTMKLIGEDELKRHNKTASKWHLIPLVLLFGAFIYFKDFYIQLVIALLLGLIMAIGGYLHHKKLKALKFDPIFVERLQKISYLSFIGSGLLLSSFLLNSYSN